MQKKKKTTSPLDLNSPALFTLNAFLSGLQANEPNKRHAALTSSTLDIRCKEYSENQQIKSLKKRVLLSSLCLSCTYSP